MRPQQDLAVDDLIKLVPGHSPHFVEVLRGCLQSRPEDRLRPEELLELEWFERFREPQPAAAGGGERSAAAETGGGGAVAAAGAVGGGDGGLEKRIPDAVGGTGEVLEGSEGVGEEEHSDLDEAARVVREYILRAVEGGVLAGAGAGATGGFPGVGGGGVGGGDRKGSSGSGMIRTMRRWVGSVDAPPAWLLLPETLRLGCSLRGYRRLCSASRDVVDVRGVVL